MLSLRDAELLFVGGTRFVYQHPEHADRCIKVLRPERTGAARRAGKRGWKRLLPASAFDDQLKELRAYEALLARDNPQQWQYVPQYFGTVHTDAGLGIVTQLLRNDDGSWPQNLERLLPRGMGTTLHRALRDFAKGIFEQRILTRDLLPHNMIAVFDGGAAQEQLQATTASKSQAAQRSDDSGKRCRVMVVDGIGNAEFLPLASHSDWAAQAKLRRKLKRMELRVQLLLPVSQQENLQLCNF